MTGRAGVPHITSQQERQKNQGLWGTGAYILNTGNQLEAVVQSANEIEIKDGALMSQGALFSVPVGTVDSVPIQNGTQGMQRKDLIVARYTYTSGTNTESAEWVAIQGTPSANNPVIPDSISGNIQEGDATVDTPVFVVNLNGINITSIDTIPSLIPAIPDINARFSNGIWSVIETRTDRGKIYLDQTKYQDIFCELRLFEQYAEMNFPVPYIDQIPTDIEKSFCVGGYQTSQYPGTWFEIKCGKIGSEKPYIYFNRGFVNGTEIDYSSGNYGISVWGKQYM